MELIEHGQSGSFISRVQRQQWRANCVDSINVFLVNHPIDDGESSNITLHGVEIGCVEWRPSKEKWLANCNGGRREEAASKLIYQIKI